MKRLVHRHLLVLGCAIIPAVIGLFVFNTLVDPTRLLAMPWQMDHFDDTRSIEGQTRMGKAGLIHSHTDVETAIIGSSRAALGLRANHEEWASEKTLNLGIPCGLLQENVVVLDYLLDRAPHLERVVMNLDLGDLSSDADSRPIADFMSSPFHEPISLETKLRLALGNSSLRAATETIEYSLNGETPAFNRYGDWVDSGFVNPWPWYVSELQKISDGASSRNQYDPSQIRQHKLEALKAVLSRCLSNDIKVTLLTIPTHAINNVWLHEGPPPAASYETDIRIIVSLVGALRDEFPEGSITWWNFQDFHVLNRETLPMPGLDIPKPVYWHDHVHPNPEIGRIIAARTSGTKVPDHPGPPYGTEVDPSNVESFIDHLLKGNEDYLRTHAQDIERARSHIRSDS